MLRDTDIVPLSLHGDNESGATRDFLEISPCAIGLWSHDRSFCLLSHSAQRLINYTEADFLARRCVWGERIHPEDKNNFSQSQEVLKAGRSPVQCDYRFFPKNAQNPVWFREVSALNASRGRGRWDIFSVYADISDLKANKPAEVKQDDVINAIRGVSHELMNRVQKVIMELELAKLGVKRTLASDNLVSTVDAMNRSVIGLRGQLVDLLESSAPHDPAVILDVIVQKMRKELHRQRVNLRLVRRGPLPMVRGDRDQLLSAFEKVFKSCGAMLKRGGNLEVEARPKEVGGQLYAEVTVMSSSAASFEPAEFEASQRLGGGEIHQIDIAMALAAEIFGRYSGQVSFRKEGKNSGEVTILIKASPP